MSKTKSKQAKRPPSKRGRQSVLPPQAKQRARARDWVGALRLPTLPLSVAPVILGGAVGYLITQVPGEPWAHWLRLATCLAIALCLQIGVNFANDYSDGVRGTDSRRSAQAPGRLVASGKAKPRTVLTIAIVFFALAAVAGLILTWRTGHWWFLAVGAVAILAAWFYTGGKRPYGYMALGEVMVFLFFGLVATLGTAYAISGEFRLYGLLAAVIAGCFATATILIANTRDIATDRLSGKRTLSVLIGDRASRIVYVVLLGIAFVVLGLLVAWFFDRALYAFGGLLIAIPAAVIALTAKTPRELVLVLRLTTATSLVVALLLGWAIAF